MKNHLTKSINGKSFNWATREFNKELAGKKAKDFKNNGYYVRVIDNCVYVCSK